MSDININQNEQAREAERAVLGGLMLETHRFDTVIQVIKENDFDGKDHQIIFQSMSELVEENKPLDPLTVSEICAPLSIQYFTRSSLISNSWSETNGSNQPRRSISLPSLLFLESIATIRKNGLFLRPCRCNLIITAKLTPY